MIVYCNFSLWNVRNLSETNSINNAAKLLGVSTHKLKRFLARFTITDKNNVVHILNYEYLYLLKDLPSSLPDYRIFIEKNGGVIHKFEEMSLRKVHQIFQLSDTIEDCANALNIKISTLQKWLQNKTESNNTAPPLTFDNFKKMTEADAQQLYNKEYDDLVIMPTFKIANKTLHQVHKALIILNTLSKVAEKFKIPTVDLHNFISSFTDSENNVLTSSRLQSMSIEVAKILFEEQYGIHDQSGVSQNDEPITDLSKITVKDIYRVAKKYQIGHASKIIGIEETALKRFLARISFTNENNCLELLSFERLRNMSKADAEKYLDDAFTKPNPGKEAVLGNFTLRQFHQLLISSSVKMLSIQFSTPKTALRRKIISMLENQPNQFKIHFNLIQLKNTSTEEAVTLFGNNYDAYMNPSDVAHTSATTKVSRSSFFNEAKRQNNETVELSSDNSKKLKFATDDDSNNISNCNNTIIYNGNDFNDNDNDFDNFNFEDYNLDSNSDNDEDKNYYQKNMW
ncbi:MAG: hypothetical protein WC627_02570 [Legionella sp.]|jgi:transposase-like protein